MSRSLLRIISYCYTKVLIYKMFISNVLILSYLGIVNLHSYLHVQQNYVKANFYTIYLSRGTMRIPIHSQTHLRQKLIAKLMTYSKICLIEDLGSGPLN